ncbi:hypothetical protein EYF80_024548 [Liparis tanakae]|uniref:Uncharacterized protein n=1 Tax=Liparis tanakae TaxID=230148 RepID=A0A4Z2HH88_9TELE|nr:hypothetical protein EYF80_024548 [Liparis tanakae]
MLELEVIYTIWSEMQSLLNVRLRGSARPPGGEQLQIGISCARLAESRGMCTRNTRRTRVFFRPTSVSPFRSSMSAFRSFRIPAQSILREGHVDRDLQDFGAVDDLLVAGGRDRLPGDAVDLVEGVGLEDALVSRPDKDLEGERLLASVAM